MKNVNLLRFQAGVKVQGEDWTSSGRLNTYIYQTEEVSVSWVGGKVCEVSL